MNNESGGIIPRMVMRHNSNIDDILNFDDDDCY